MLKEFHKMAIDSAVLTGWVKPQRPKACGRINCEGCPARYRFACGRQD